MGSLSGPLRRKWDLRISSPSVRIAFIARANIKSAMSYALAVTLKRVPYGWAVCLTNGRELVRFQGLGARCRALRYLRALEL